MQPGPVIFLVSHASPGGAQELWADLAEGFRAAGHDVRLMALYPSPDAREMASHLCWHNVRGAKPTTVPGALELIVQLVRLFRRERPAMVFTALPAANVLAPLAARIASTGTRVCISHHSPVSTHQPFLNFLDGVTGSLACTSSVIAVSDSVSRSLDTKPRAYRRKRRTIHNALPPRVVARLQALCVARGALPGRRRKVVAIGRLAEEKNYPVLLRAAARMPGVAFDIVGAGPLEACLKGLAEALGISARVRFLGHLAREQAMEVLAGADVFAQPSMFEGHSLALMEAARLGVPLVVSDVAAQVEGITRLDGVRCGITVGLHDDHALAGALQQLLDEPAWHSRWAGAAARLAEEASYVRMLSSYQGLMAP